MIVAGATAYPRIIDPEPFREIADEVGALFMFDAAHIAGLIAGGVAPQPGAATPTSSPSPPTRRCAARAAAASCARPSTPRRSTRRCSPGSQGGPLEHVIAAKAVAFHEAAAARVHATTPRQIVANAARAGRGAGRRGLPARVGRHRQPPDARRPAHLRRGAHRQGGPGVARPGRHHPQQEHRSPTTPGRRSSRAGCASARRRSPPQGMGEPRDGARSRRSSHRALRDRDDDDELAAVRDEVAALCSKFTPYPQLSGRRSGLMPDRDRLRGRASRWRPSASRSSLTPLVRRLAIRLGAVVAPDERRVHNVPTPTLGGVAMFVGFLVGHGRGLAARRRSPRCSTASSEPLGVVLGAVDHLRGRHCSTTCARCRRRRRSPGMVLAGSILSLLGVTMFYFRIPFVGLVVLVARPGAARHRALGASAWPTPSTSSTGSTGWPPASSPSPPARSSSTATGSTDAALLDAGQHRPAARGHRARHLRRASCPTTSTRPASSWATAARCSSGC